jgi:hypothetical protein
MTQSINQSTNQSLRRCKQFLKFRRSVVTAMLLLNTLPVFAQRTDVIPTEGKWTPSFGNQPLDSLQAACEFDFNIIYKDQAPIFPEIFPVSTPACWIHSLSPDKYSYDRYNNIGYCYTERPKLEIKLDKGEIIFVCANDFDYIYLSSVAHTPPTCPAPANGQRAAADCTQTVSLTPVSGQAEPRPKGSEGGDGKSTYDLIAKVTEGNQPKAGMALTFTVEVEAGSGNHPLNPPDRPTGELSVKSGTTNASGEVKVTFTSPIFSGTHKVKVSCAKCTGTVKEDTEIINVKVPNLSSFLADTKKPARWNFIGTDKYHNQERFYLTKVAADNLRSLIDAIQLVKSDKTGKPWGVVGLNDASLPWGGRYNAYNPDDPTPYRWNAVITNGFHEGHRLGVEIDIQIKNHQNNDINHVRKTYDEVCKDPQVTAKILYHYKKGPHFHAYLLGDLGKTQANKELGSSPCWKSPK